MAVGVAQVPRLLHHEQPPVPIGTGGTDRQRSMEGNPTRSTKKRRRFGVGTRTLLTTRRSREGVPRSLIEALTPLELAMSSPVASRLPFLGSLASTKCAAFSYSPVTDGFPCSKQQIFRPRSVPTCHLLPLALSFLV